MPGLIHEKEQNNQRLKEAVERRLKESGRNGITISAIEDLGEIYVLVFKDADGKEAQLSISRMQGFDWIIRESVLQANGEVLSA